MQKNKEIITKIYLFTSCHPASVLDRSKNCIRSIDNMIRLTDVL